jgi:glycerol-3-phosphate dehydrogenase
LAKFNKQMNGKTKFAVIGGGSWATAIKNVMRKSF